jgi:hypothetical protein
MLASLLTNMLLLRFILGSPLALIFFVFQIWMFIHAVRNRDWIWAVLIFCGLGIWYFFYVYRDSLATRGFELPGAHKRRRIKELQAQIYHLDKAHHHSELGDIYFQKGKLAEAEASYRASLERDPQDIDTRAHFGQCLLREKRPKEALPLLEGVVRENPKHDYGYSMMAYAETLAALGNAESAFRAWKQVTETNSYARAKVQLAELHIARKELDAARQQLYEVVTEDAHAPRYERRRSRVWVRQAKRLLRKI